MRQWLAVMTATVFVETSERAGQDLCGPPAGTVSLRPVRKRPQFLRAWKMLRGLPSKPVNLKAAQDASAFKNESAAKIVLRAEQEVAQDMDARRLGIAPADLKVEACTSALAFPRRSFGAGQLRQESRRLWRPVLKHPSSKGSFCFCQRSICHCAQNSVQRPKLGQPARGTLGLQPERDGRARWSAWLDLNNINISCVLAGE